VDQIVEAPPRENGMVRAKDAARHLPWGSIAAVLAFLLMSAAAIGFYWSGVDSDEPAGGLSDQLRSNFADFFSNLYTNPPCRFSSAWRCSVSRWRG
jgi:hypothetical protein